MDFMNSIKRIVKACRSMLRRSGLDTPILAIEPETSPETPENKRLEILDAYILKEPDNQNVIDIFQGEWASYLPASSGVITKPGEADLFEDARVTWTEEVFGNFKNWTILELGPLEAGHSYMFQQRHAAKIVSIEANTRAFLKCLCIKEILGLDRVGFKLGDFMSFLRSDNSKYDMVFASGVLYHMEDPLELLHLISKVSERAFIWTHYYDTDIITANDTLAHKFNPVCSMDYEGISYEYSTQSYKEALNWSGFCGGPQPVSKWLTRDSLIKALKQFGFVNIQINFDHHHHPNGPALAICAAKQPLSGKIKQ